MDFMGHWKLRERPFEATWDPRFFYGSPQHLEALNRLVYFVMERTMTACLLSGEIGCGKTLTRAVFTKQLDSAKFHVLTIENSGFTFSEIVEAILYRLDADCLGRITTTMARCDHLARLLQHIHSQGRHVVLLLDEAQDMNPQTLHDLRWLTNYNSDGRAYLSMVLIGQPEIKQHVISNAALDQRVSLRFHLGALTLADVPYYLSHRLRVAGHETGALFTREACLALQSHSRGIPRELNRFAKLSLEQAWVLEHTIVDVGVVQTVVSDLSSHQTMAAA
jgi:type II secretory pathway predicted ATPase ExeA